MRRLMLIVAALAATQAGWGDSSVAAERTRCVTDGPFAAEVHEAQRDDGPGPARLSARLSGSAITLCARSAGPAERHLQIHQALTVIEHHAGSCFAGTSTIPTPGFLRGRTELTVAITSPDGEIRRLDFHGVVDGTSQPDRHDPTTCALDLEVRAQAANGAKLALHILATYDRTTATLTDALYSTSEADTY